MKQPTIRYGPLTIRCPCGKIMHRKDYTASQWVRKKYCSVACNYANKNDRRPLEWTTNYSR